MKLALICLLLANSAGSARILVNQVSVSESHSAVMGPLFEELAARGHQLTVLTCFPRGSQKQNWREIDLSHRWEPVVSNFSFDFIKKTMPGPFKTPISMADLELLMCKNVLPDKEIRKLLESDDKYDLVITETFLADCFVPFAHRFRAPLISFVTSSVLPWVSDRLGLPDNPSYIPNYLSKLSPNMTLLQRIYNFVLLTFAKFIQKHDVVPRSQSLVNKYFGGSTPPLHELLINTSLVFVNSHFSLGLVRPTASNVVEVGGIHMGAPSLLRSDMQQILDRSSQGVIVVSFGSLVRVSSLPQHVIRMFLKAFSTIPQTVIFKYEEDLPEAPQNVVIRKWLSQREIIGHRNVRALLTHGGMASIIEAVYYSKPLIGVPFFADQHLNVKAIAARGAGIFLELDTLSSNMLRTAIDNVLNDSSYTENIQQLSQQFRDRPMTALQTAVYWTEYVIRHQGAPHLRPASVSLPLYQYLLLDVVAFLLVPILIFLYLIKSLLFKNVKIRFENPQ